MSGELGGPFSWPPGWRVTYVLRNCGSPGRDCVQTGVIAGSAQIRPTTGRVVVPVRLGTAPPTALPQWVCESDIVALLPPRPDAAA